MELQKIWILMWMVANVISFTPLWFMILAILRSRRARGQLFNVYLLFSVLSDATKNIIVFVCNLINFFQFSPRACTTIGWIDSYYIVSNLWMGAVVFNELQGLLIDMKQCKRISKSTNQEEKKKWKYMYLKSISVHIFALCISSIMLETSIDWIPDISINTGCEPLPTNEKESYYFWFVYVLLGMIIPTVYVLYVCCNIYKQKILPTTGKTRALLFYFVRMLVMFFVLWIIFIIAVFLKGWPQAIAFVLYNLAGFLSFCFAMTKPDISEAVIDMIFCKGQRLTVKEVINGKSATSRISVSTKKEENIENNNNNSITSLHDALGGGEERMLEEGNTNSFTLHNNNNNDTNSDCIFRNKEENIETKYNNSITSLHDALGGGEERMLEEGDTNSFMLHNNNNNDTDSDCIFRNKSSSLTEAADLENIETK